MVFQQLRTPELLTTPFFGKGIASAVYFCFDATELNVELMLLLWAQDD